MKTFAWFHQDTNNPKNIVMNSFVPLQNQPLFAETKLFNNYSDEHKPMTFQYCEYNLKLTLYCRSNKVYIRYIPYVDQYFRYFGAD